MASERQQSLDNFARRQGYDSYYQYRNSRAEAKGFSGYGEQRQIRAQVAAITSNSTRGRAVEIRDHLALQVKKASENLAENLGGAVGALSDIESFVLLLETGNTGLSQDELLAQAADILGLDPEDDAGEIWEWIREHYPSHK